MESIFIEGLDVDGPRRDIGIMFQKPLLLEWRRVLDNVLLPVEIYRLNRKEYEKKARRLLDTAGLADFLTNIRLSFPAACSNALPSAARSSPNLRCF